VRTILDEELRAWAELGVEGHVEGERPWKPYHAFLREPLARLVGAQPRGDRRDELAHGQPAPADGQLLPAHARPGTRSSSRTARSPRTPTPCAARSALHGFDPEAAVIRLRPRAGEDTLRTEDVLAALDDRVALVLLGGVNYLTGELMDIPAITAAGRRAGAVVGWDLAHAVGNVPLALSEWGVDWAAWCHYKYVNSGPGAVAGAFVHRRHLGDRTLPKLQGWWSSNEATRFAMGPVVDPVDTADAWQLSNPPILAMAPVLASLRSSTRSAWRPCANAACGSPATWRRCWTAGGPPAAPAHAPGPAAQRRPAVGAHRGGHGAGRVRPAAPRARGDRRRARARRRAARARAAVLHPPRRVAGGQGAGGGGSDDN
jgi:kynureninase